jgi:hypothetical protein
MGDFVQVVLNKTVIFILEKNIMLLCFRIMGASQSSGIKDDDKLRVNEGFCLYILSHYSSMYMLWKRKRLRSNSSS